MLESYSILVLAGLCVLLVIWIHAQQTRRSYQPTSGGHENVLRAPAMYAYRTGKELSYSELEEMSREGGFQTYRLKDSEPLIEVLLPFDRLRQTEMPLQMPGEQLLLILHVNFQEPCPGDALYDFLTQAGLLLAKDGLYRKVQTSRGTATPIYYVANHSPRGSFREQKEMIARIGGLTLFTQLPLPMNGLHVLKGMLRIAEDICKHFGGALLDEKQRPLTGERTERLIRNVKARAPGHLHSNQIPMH